MAGEGERPFIIAQISDLHCGGPYFVPNLLERAISEVNELQPDIVICSGDLTTFGFKEEYADAKRYGAEPSEVAPADRQVWNTQEGAVVVERQGSAVVILEGVPDGFTAGQAYRITIALSQPAMKLAGSQLTARFKSDGVQAGMLAKESDTDRRVGMGE